MDHLPGVAAHTNSRRVNYREQHILTAHVFRSTSITEPRLLTIPNTLGTHLRSLLAITYVAGYLRRVVPSLYRDLVLSLLSWRRYSSRYYIQIESSCCSKVIFVY